MSAISTHAVPSQEPKRTIPLVYAVILMCLALYGAIYAWKENRTAGTDKPSLLKVLIEDQMLYFLM